MKAIILAAGEGIRMRPLTLEKPKPLLEVTGKPLLRHIYESLPDVIDEVVLVVGYKGDLIKKHFGSEFAGKKISYVEQLEKLGTAHALGLCRPHLSEGEKFLLLYADDLQHKESMTRLLRHDNALLVHKVEDPRRFGVVVTNDGGKILDIEEKPKNPKTNLVAIGVYVLNYNIFKYELHEKKNGEYFLTDMIKSMIKDQDVFAEETSFWHPIGYPEDLKKAEIILSQRFQGDVADPK
ncbi:MAG: sugar phosphate nucleotidyltransferase [bacterium]|nr:sugar phosphate nucleotidyltransferase [bacterium]